jgi:quinol monooxygenase YgiN
MHNERREFLFTAGALAMTTFGLRFPVATGSHPNMYGLIGKMIASPGQRETLIAILLEGTGEMPGCLSYVVAKDTTDDNAIWITEVWADKESHDNSLMLPAVKAAMAKARPLIAGFEKGIETKPVGGQGID